MAITMDDLLRQSKSPIQKYVIQNLLRDGTGLIPLIPMRKVDILNPVVTRWKTLPTVAFRQVGGAHAESTGKTEQVTEGLYGLGGDILFDRVYDLVGNTIEDVKRTQTNMKLKAAKLQFVKSFVNGDHATNVDEFEGLNKRVASYLPSRQSISIGSAFDATASTANTQKLIYYMHQLIDLAGLRNAPPIQQKVGGKVKSTEMVSGAIFCNRDFKLAFEKALRTVSSLIDTTQDNYGRFFQTFAGVPIIDVGLQADQSTEIIANNYGGGTNETRVFACRFSSEDGDDGLACLYLNEPDLYDPVAEGEVGASATAGTPAKSLRLDWWLGLGGWGSYYAARLTGLKDPTLWT